MRSTMRTPLLAAAYLAVYILAAGLDLWTTEIALGRAGVSEGNVFATDSGGYAASRAFAINAIGGVVMVITVVFAFANANRVAEVWLRQPMQSFAKFYIIPWKEAVMDRSPLHALSYAIAFVVLRLIAAANNVFISEYGVAPLGSLVKAVATWTTPVIGLVVVIGGIYFALSIVMAPMAARLIAAERTDS